MDKFCVFCGNKPKGKNNEHIIPKWLIEFTGDAWTGRPYVAITMQMKCGKRGVD